MMVRQVRFLQELISDQPTGRPFSLTAHHFADTMGIGRVLGSRVVYAPKDFSAARNLLLSRGFPLSRSAKVPLLVQKDHARAGRSITSRVPDHFVAVVPMGLRSVNVPLGGMLCMKHQDAVALPYEVLVLCEHLQPMLSIHSYLWMADHLKGRPALALFRGAPGYFRADVARQMLARDTRPVLALVDFDPKGLSIAATTPRLESLCLPPAESLANAVRAHGRKELFLASTGPTRRRLNGPLMPTDVCQAWTQMNSMGLGLELACFPSK